MAPLRTPNLNLSSSVRYLDKPIRIKTTATVWGGPKLVQVNVPDVHFPPDTAMFVDLESIKHREGFANWCYIIDASTTDQRQGIPSNGFVVRTRGLCEESFTTGGIGESYVDFSNPPSGAFYGDVPVPQAVVDIFTNSDTLSNSAPRGKYLDARNLVDTSTMGRPLAHSNLQFSFMMEVWNKDRAAGSSEWYPAASTDTENVEITFLIYPNTFWKQRF